MLKSDTNCSHQVSPFREIHFLSKLAVMPTVLRVKGYRFFFFSLEGSEPPHIHVELAEKVAKFWLNPVALVKSRGFRSGELSEMQRIVE
ncbi:MAG TPA: DUF4160 domain-containing protein, partial [Pyrinomonadaceae bacterium]|nr:DUF4160 domain-containing protein [Pyrinomonadaceae bacterium]